MAKFEHYLYQGGVRMRCGYTTGSCAALAAKAAARRLLLGQLLRSNLRLFITGFFVYTALVAFRASPFALAAGLSAAVLILPVLFLFRYNSRAEK